MDTTQNVEDLETLEVRLLLESVAQAYGYDFREYAYASIKRRIDSALQAERLPNISALQGRILHDPMCMERFLLSVTVHSTSMYRDPDFYRAFRNEVVGHLRTYPYIRLWLAGCSSGEEIYSMAILLKEEGLLQRSRIYATDLSESVLAKARTGIFPLRFMKEYTENYISAGGKSNFCDYYATDSEHAVFDNSLKENVVFSPHNLVSDASFNEFQVVLCRNVMIYFKESLQHRVLELFHKSLCLFGVLGIGNKESIKFTPYEFCYEQLDGQAKIFRRIK